MDRRFIVLTSIILAILAAGRAGAEYNPITKKNEIILISTAKERSIGRSISKSLEKEFGLCKDERLVDRVDRIGQRVALVSDRKDVTYRFKVLDSDEVNAMALPGGYIYVNRGLLEKVEDDNELACVLGHEIGHVVMKHAVKRLQTALGFTAFKILASRMPQDRRFSRGTDLAFISMILDYSKEDEFMADRLSVKYAKEAGFDPGAAITFLQRLRDIHRKKPLRKASFFRSHPYICERIKAVKEEAFGKIDFVDYINVPAER